MGGSAARVESLYAQHTPPDQIVVVIDYNRELFDRAQREFSGVDVVENVETKGLSGARNTGIEHAHGDVIAFLDDDAAAHVDWLDRIALHYRDDSVTGWAATSRPCGPAPGPGGSCPNTTGLWVVRTSGCRPPPTMCATSSVRTCRFAVRYSPKSADSRTRCGRIGVLPAGCEETELCIRARTENPTIRLVYDPAAIVDHYISVDRLDLSYFLARCYREGISKAGVARLSDTNKALENERTYVWSVLPRAAWRELRVGAPLTALLVYVGVALAGVGFVRGRLPRRPSLTTGRRHASALRRMCRRYMVSPNQERTMPMRPAIVGWPAVSTSMARKSSRTLRPMARPCSLLTVLACRRKPLRLTGSTAQSRARGCDTMRRNR